MTGRRRGAAPGIKTFEPIEPMIYAYQTPGVTYHEGWTKIGYTEKQTPEERVKEQTHTAGIRADICWTGSATYADGARFTDHEFHSYLRKKGVEREPDTEWFRIGDQESHGLFNEFVSSKDPASQSGCTYRLRQEQQEAVNKAKTYFDNGGEEFLWNAKPRFGKTLAAYELMLEAGFKKVLIVTNRPSVANSWLEDFRKFIAWQHHYAFVSDNDALRGKQGVLTRKEYLHSFHTNEKFEGLVCFESLQGLKGSVYFGGNVDKLDWLAKEHTDEGGRLVNGINFDLLIVDESQEGVSTAKTERAFKNIGREHTLYLSGTPFKQLASGDFDDDQIFNWTYADEQEAKLSWDSDGFNPYETLPSLTMYTYELSNMIFDELRKPDLSDDGDGKTDYVFDLNEFFSTNGKGSFKHEEEVKKFLHALATQEKYPYSTPELRRELSHTLWLLDRVDSAKAMKRLLEKDELFGEYDVVLAAGDGKLEGDEALEDTRSYDRVMSAIEKHDKTITLSVGQLTVGVTIPQWSGVLMLCNMKSPSSYMQAAFRAQNPCEVKYDGARYRKKNAYVFDFDPARTLIVYDEFANNLSMETVAGRGTTDEHQANIRRLLNFFPVLGEDDEGRMVELDASRVLSIPRRIKSTEVVRRGFMSNFLFQNIGAVFGAPGIVTEVLEKLTSAKEAPVKKMAPPEGVVVDENGDVVISDEDAANKAREVLGGEKVYETMEEEILSDINEAQPHDDFDTVLEQTAAKTKTAFEQAVMEPIAQEYDLKPREKSRLNKEVGKDIDKTFESMKEDFEQNSRIAKIAYEKQRNAAVTQAELKKADEDFQTKIATITQECTDAIQAQVGELVDTKPKEVVAKIEKSRAEAKKKGFEDDVRAKLRGFSRTIPSFLMAYGDENITLRNLDEYTEDDVFEEVTGITEDNFRFLRDGGDYINEQGQEEHFNGNLFDEVVFDDSIKVFMQKRGDLANYFDEKNDEDIFDYIPPQKTNQIYTPRKVVVRMVDDLEKENPGCFDDPTATFADLYMKSGLYITEIVKRLYKSEKIKGAIPDDGERIRHILREQVYGMAPTRIIYLISTNYILGFDESLKSETKNFVEADAAAAAKAGTLEQLVEEKFGRKTSE